MIHKKAIMAFLAALNSFSCASFVRGSKNISISNSNSGTKNDPKKIVPDNKNRRIINKKTDSNSKIITHTVLPILTVVPIASFATWHFTKKNNEEKCNEMYRHWQDDEIDKIAKYLVYSYWVRNYALSGISFSEFLTESKKAKLTESIENLSFLGFTLYNFLKQPVNISGFWQAAGSPNYGQKIENWMYEFKELLGKIEWDDIKTGKKTCTSSNYKLRVDLWIEDGVLHWDNLGYNK